MVMTHSCWRRPLWIGVETAVTVPDEMARRKSVLLFTPTTVPPLPEAVSQTCAETLARLSTIEQYTPPCTIPHGCSRESLMVSCARPPSGVTSRKVNPSSLSKPAPSPGGTEEVTVCVLHAAEMAPECGR